MYPLQPGQDSGSVLGLKRKWIKGLKHSVSKCKSLGCNGGDAISLIFLNISWERPDSWCILYCKIGIPFSCTTSNAFFNYCPGITAIDCSFLTSLSLRDVLNITTPIPWKVPLPFKEETSWSTLSPDLTFFIISLTFSFTVVDCLYLVTSSGLTLNLSLLSLINCYLETNVWSTSTPSNII